MPTHDNGNIDYDDIQDNIKNNNNNINLMTSPKYRRNTMQKFESTTKTMNLEREESKKKKNETTPNNEVFRCHKT